MTQNDGAEVSQPRLKRDSSQMLTKKGDISTPVSQESLIWEKEAQSFLDCELLGTRKKIRPRASGIKSFLNRAPTPTIRRIQMPRLPMKAPQDAYCKCKDSRPKKMKPPSHDQRLNTKFSSILILGISAIFLGLFTVFWFLDLSNYSEYLIENFTYHHLIPNQIRESTLFFLMIIHLLNKAERFLRQKELTDRRPPMKFDGHEIKGKSIRYPTTKHPVTFGLLRWHVLPREAQESGAMYKAGLIAEATVLAIIHGLQR